MENKVKPSGSSFFPTPQVQVKHQFSHLYNQGSTTYFINWNEIMWVKIPGIILATEQMPNKKKKSSSWHWILGRLVPEYLQNISIAHPPSQPCCCQDESGGWSEPCLEEQKALRGRKERHMVRGDPNCQKAFSFSWISNPNAISRSQCPRGKTTTLQRHRAPGAPCAPEWSALLPPVSSAPVMPKLHATGLLALNGCFPPLPRQHLWEQRKPQSVTARS